MIVVRIAARWPGSRTPHISRAECIDSPGTPTSTVVTPSRAAVSGPIDVPHGIALLETNGCQGAPARSAAAVSTAMPVESVAYRWLTFTLTVGPPLGSGRWSGSCRSA